MRSLHLVVFGLCIYILAGCGSTKETSDMKEPSRVITEELPPPPPENPEKVVVENFSIQIGAFEKEENALQFAYNAKNLFKEEIYNIYDSAKRIYRVMVGNFWSKEAATEFHDQFVKKFPDYNNAWVIDVNNEVTR
ncbi:MAG: SPOR domain-containing protein [Bacteroidota bacterium]|nr:SPOR domain-containing protein [Bacteroidota bacterium]